MNFRYLFGELMLPVLVMGIVLWAVGLVHCLAVRDGSLCRHGTKNQWLFLILALGLPGAALYLCIGRPPKLTSS